MEHIIAGRFETKAIADAAASALREYVGIGDICIFHNNPPGQHDVYPVGGDESEDPSAAGAENSALGPAVAGGLAAGAVGALGGPVIALVAAAAGAYTGAVAGMISGLGEHDGEPGVAGRRHGGVMLSVRIAAAGGEQRVIDTLRGQGAADIERAEGAWLDGDWTDFDPVAAPRLVSPASA